MFLFHHDTAAASANQTRNASDCSFPGAGTATRLVALSPARNLSLASPGNSTNFTALSYALNDTLQYACLPGHSLASGSLVLTCTEAGLWDAGLPDCVGDDEGLLYDTGVMQKVVNACVRLNKLRKSTVVHSLPYTRRLFKYNMCVYVYINSIYVRT